MPYKKKKGGKPRQPPSRAPDLQLPRLPPNPTMVQDSPPQPQPQPQSQSPAREEDAATPPPPAPAHPQDVEDGGEKEEEAQAMAASLPAPSDLAAPELPVPNPAPASRKPSGKRKKPFTEKQRAAVQQKVALLKENLRPFPFVPEKTLDLSKHEQLFRALGLWDFAHVQLDREIRSDFLMALISHYDPPNRRSFVNDVRISVSRADLARALSLPVKKEKTGALEGGDSQQELFSREESVTAIMDFMSTYMLFQFQDDACILPAEVVTVTRMVKEGQPQKVDWAGLMWSFVEKELLEVPKSGDCYYASHLQCLMKHQQPGLFEEEAEPKYEPVPEPEHEIESEPKPEPSTEVPVEDEEVPMEEEEDDADDGVTRTRSLEDFSDAGHEKHGPGLSLGLGGDADVDVMDSFEECKEGDEEQWLPEEKNEGVDHCLQRCSLSAGGGMEFENLSKEVGEGRAEEGYVDDISAKFASLERLTSTDLLQAMDTVNVPYNLPVNTLDPSSGEFLAMRSDGADAQKTVSLNHGPGGSFFFGSNGKRHIGEIDDDDDDDDEDIHRFSQNNQQKRMRSDGIWERAPSDFETCMEQVQSCMAKAKILFAEKEQTCMNAQLELQYMNHVLQQKDQIIHSLEKTRMEEQQKWQLEAHRCEHELNVMAQLVFGYKKALRETRLAFAEYRKKFPQGDEPLYKDVGGTGGVVLSTRELERQRLQKEEEMRIAVAEMINDFQKEWLGKLDQYASFLAVLTKRITGLEGEIRLLKQNFVAIKGSNTQAA
ncbi:hypothetical protein COCNU_02G002800 [Cocos nucifera]|uniref:Uncharacterized protein n=1 Tax=Cocos nucifera TaxID=13894 RepID=A0A8K0HYP6_COCNU|nr:hypothetical protein COCNU_02G002800 [Cocos nucifera]